MKYTSITRNFRGFNYQSDWDSIKDWEKAVKDQIVSDGNEVEWSILIDSTFGLPDRRYRRGAGITRFEIAEIPVVKHFEGW